MARLLQFSNEKTRQKLLNINPNEPESKTQCEMILKALKAGEKLTHLDAEKRFQCLRLGARIYDLKKHGFDIERQMITVKSGKRVAQYSMVVA